MSYEVEVYAATLLSESRRAEFAERARRADGLTFADPVSARDEDLPDLVLAQRLDVVAVYAISGPAPLATEFARDVAAATRGAVLDRQTDEVWTPAGGARQLTPPPAQLIDVVELRWYTRADREPADLAGSYLALAQRVLPEALPRRFGVFEPLDASLDTDGNAAFVAARDGADTLFFKGTFPCFEGSLAPARPRFVDGPVRGHTLTVDRAALGDPALRRAVQAFFVRFALSGKAFFASAEVQRGVQWDGQALGYGAEAESVSYLAARGQWQGPPSYPVWWSWSTDGRPDFGDVGVTRVYGEATFHAWVPEPADRDQLAALG